MPVCCNRFRASASDQYGPLGGENPVGFNPNGVSDTLEPAEPVTANPGTVNSDGSPNKPNVGVGYAAGTSGGYGPEGVNGSQVFLPFGLDPKRTPVMGSYDENTVAAKATSSWYELPPRTPDRPLVTVAAAGAIWYYEEDRSFNYGQSLKLQWGVHRPDGSYQALGQVQPIDIFMQKAWRNLRFPLAWAPPEANVARIVADDPNLSTDQWFAFTPPRVPVLRDRATDDGVADAGADGHRHRLRTSRASARSPNTLAWPNFRSTASSRTSSRRWCRRTSGSPREDGGPLLITQALLRSDSVPSYLRDDWYRDWGAIERYHRLVPESEAPDAVIDQGSVTVRGWSRTDRSGRCHERTNQCKACDPLGRDDRGPDRLRAVGRDAAAAGGADHRDAELAAERSAQ